MDTEWYYSSNGQQMGPVSYEQLKQRAQSGSLLPSDLVWKEGLPDWVAAVKVEGLLPPSDSAPKSPVSININANDEFTQVDELDRETLQSFINKFILTIALAVAQDFINYVPGTEILLGGYALGVWVRVGIAIGIIVLMVLNLSPLRHVTLYYIGLIFRTKLRMSNEPELRTHVSRSALYFILAVYVAVVYWGVLPPIFNLFLLHSPLLLLLRLGVATIGIIFVINLWLSLRPLIMHASNKISDRTLEATKKIDSKPCPSCGGRTSLTSNFCSACGKAV